VADRGGVRSSRRVFGPAASLAARVPGALTEELRLVGRPSVTDFGRRRAPLLWALWAAAFCGPPPSADAAQGGGSLLDRALAGPMAGTREVVFAVRARGRDGHWYANFGYWSADPDRMMYGAGGGRLCKLDLRTRKLTILLDDPTGGVRDPCIDYDGRTVLFAYRKGGTRFYNLYEIGVDGAGLRQITRGAWDDIEPAYLPAGDIVFCSSRCKRWVNCWHTQVAILYRCDADGRHIRPISSNIEHDNTPAVLPDGRLLYTRWEYVDRSQVDFHHLWTINPDGTGQMAYYGNMHARMLMIDGRPIPGSDKVAAIFSPGHGANEHRGTLTVIRPDAGPDTRGFAQPVQACPKWVRDPYPFSETCFLVARGHQLVLVDAAANRHAVVHSLGEPDRRRKLELHEPCAVRPRPREPVVPDRVDPSQRTGRLILADVTHGRKMAGVRPGQVRKLLVLETLPKPVNFSGGPEPLSFLGTFTLERVLGTVGVEADGSAYVELPANRPVFFVALDRRDLSVKRMQSFVSVMPGETTGCAGCHEGRNETARLRSSLAALRRPPSRIQPFEGLPDVMDFPRDVQPILDRHCVRCPDFRKRSGGLVLVGDRGPRYSHSFWALFAHGQVADGRNAFGNSPPRSIGTAASPLMARLRGKHHKVRLSDREWRTVWLWIESGAPYAGTYAALGTGMLWPNVWAEMGDVLRRRCASCHCPPRADGRPVKGKIALPANRHPRRRGGAAHERWVGKNLAMARRSPNVLYNLTRPSDSPLLLGPLSREAGGWGTCPGVFASRDDPDYRKLLARLRASKQHLDRIKRFDMPGFRPNVHYVREMKRYGILPAALDPARDSIDVYQTDRAYWRSFWHEPRDRD
jgi:hypothetical protein